MDADDRSEDELFEPDSPVSANATAGVAASAIPTPSANEMALNCPTYISLAARAVLAFLTAPPCAESGDGRHEHSDSTIASRGPTRLPWSAGAQPPDDPVCPSSENLCDDIPSPPKEFSAFAQRFR